jgi:hypothetical protein
MTKDNSRRSSVVALSPSPPPESKQLDEASSNNARPASLLGDVAIKLTSDITDSQPMTASNSTSSNPSVIDIGAGLVAPYGTRSRNRNGTSRPNYAEDKELDTDFEVTAAGKDNVGRKARVGETNAANLDIGRSPNTARKNTSPEGEQVVTVQNQPKEPIPGTSTFSANPSASQSSKKRKATGQPPMMSHDSQLQGPPHALPTAQAVTRRASMAAQVVAGFRDSNMLSFDACSSRLRGKRLVADDGTVLEVNGELHS